MENLRNSYLLNSKAYINGQWVESPDKFSVLNPATNKAIATVSNATETEAVQAINAAEKALASWSKKSAADRGILIRRWFNLIIEHQDDLAYILTLEQGKPLAEAKGEIAYGAAFFEWFAEEGKRAYGDTIPAPSGDKRIIITKQAVGVVTAITPWNFPNAMISRKAAAALAAGCTFIVKPATETPLSALALAELADQAGIPAGVFNVIVGTDSKAIGKVLTQHPSVAKFTFTGSTAVGRTLISQCATTVKKTSMELGGNAPFIVFDDADIDAAVAGAIASKFRNAGQTCVSTNRIFVQSSIKTEFIEKFAKATQKLSMGNGLEPAHNIGPLISKSARDKIHQLVKDSLNEGAEVLVGNQINENDSYYSPTILTNVKNTMTIAKNETFGPVAPIISFETEQEAIQLANDTEYGLAAYFYAQNINRVWRVSNQLQFGMIGINEGIISNAAAPFGGLKQSGNGREGSKYGLDDYMEIKYLCMGGIEQ